MLQQALNRHSQIVIPPETGFFLDFVGHTRAGQRQHLKQINADLGITLPEPPRRISRHEDVVGFYEDMADAYLERLEQNPLLGDTAAVVEDALGHANPRGLKPAARHEKTKTALRCADVVYFGDKSPRHLLGIRRIARYFPEAKFILIYRDGRDVALSLSRVPWGPSDYYVNFAIWLRFYRWHRWAASQASVDLHCVKYEGLVTTPEAELGKITEFLGIEYEPDMASASGNWEGITEREHEWKNRAFEKIDTSRVAVWRRELSPEQNRRIERWGGRALASLGYDLITDRQQRLPLTFFPCLHLRHTAWRIGRAWQLAKKELLAG